MMPYRFTVENDWGRLFQSCEDTTSYTRLAVVLLSAFWLLPSWGPPFLLPLSAVDWRVHRGGSRSRSIEGLLWRAKKEKERRERGLRGKERGLGKKERSRTGPRVQFWLANFLFFYFFFFRISNLYPKLLKLSLLILFQYGPQKFTFLPQNFLKISN